MWPFKRKKSLPSKLPFKNGESFFQMQCKYGHTELSEGQGVVAIVLDTKAMYGTEVPVKVKDDGVQIATLKVASEDGGFITFSETASGNGDRLGPGDLVVWVPGIYNEALSQKMDDERGGWIGLIVAKIAPEMSPTDNEMTVLCHY